MSFLEVKRKNKIVELIMQLKTEAFLTEIEKQVLSFSQKESQKESFWQAVRPIRKQVSFEQLLTEQNYQTPTFAIFSQSTQKLEMEESIETLLTMLK